MLSLPVVTPNDGCCQVWQRASAIELRFLVTAFDNNTGLLSWAMWGEIIPQKPVDVLLQEIHA